ncbi:MAG TPA: hypothetical protein PLZ21_13055 [Armatimonadota bacterium]|nr:hypothetical protein [Armatimonadota bacterium]HOP81487.1 hypothetical protein [Armatimonadota bacterium]
MRKRLIDQMIHTTAKTANTDTHAAKIQLVSGILAIRWIKNRMPTLMTAASTSG